MDDDDDLLARARAGSPEAFASLYQRLAGPVAGYLRLRGVRDVEDVTSEVFLAVFTGLGRFEGDLDRFRSWVFTIAHRRAVDEFRRASRGVPTQPLEPHEADLPEQSPSAEEEALVEIAGQDVEALLASLSPDQRDVLMLRVVADLTVEQVAAVVGRTPGAVKALQRRGLAQLRRRLSREGVPL